MKPIRPEKNKSRLQDTYSSSGFPSPAEDYEEPALDLHDLVVQNPPSTYFMRADTDTMHKAGISWGDILVVDRSISAKPGKAVVAIGQESFVLRRCVAIGASITLADDTDRYDTEPDKIWGVVTYIVRKT